MMQYMRVPLRFGTDQIAVAVHIPTLTPSSVLLWPTPRQKWIDKPPCVKHLRMFRFQAEVLVPKTYRSKLDVRSRTCVFPGYTDTWRNIRFFDISTGRFIICRRAKFYYCQKISTFLPDYSDESVFETLLYDATVDVGSVGSMGNNGLQNDIDDGDSNSSVVAQNEPDNEPRPAPEGRLGRSLQHSSGSRMSTY